MEESVDLSREAGNENEQTLANLSPAEKATSKDEVEIEKFLQEQKSKNTQYKTKSDLKPWKKFCEFLKESRAIKNIPANELDVLLSKFFISVRKQNGTEYEPGTKTRLLQPNSIYDTNKKKLCNHSIRKASVGRLLEADVQSNFVAQLSGHKNLKSLDSYNSASLKRQREMPAILNRFPRTSAQSEDNQVSTSTTAQKNVFTVQQIQPHAIFAGTHIDKFEGCTFNINVFCGDQPKIARLNEN